METTTIGNLENVPEGDARTVGKMKNITMKEGSLGELTILLSFEQNAKIILINF